MKLALFIALLSIGFSSPAAPLKKIRVYLDWFPSIEFAGMYVAIEKGWYKERGIEVVPVFEGIDIIPSVLAGKADIGMHSGHDLVRFSKEQKKLKAFAAVYQLNPNSILVPQSSSVKTVADLKGKTLGIFSPQERDMYRVMLGHNGLSLSEVKLTEIKTFDEAELVELLKSKKVDGFIAWEFNWTIAFSLLGFPVRVFPGYENGFHYYGIVYFAPESYLQANRNTLAKFLRATFDGWREALRNPEEATKLVVDKYYPKDKYLKGSRDLTMQEQLSELKLRKKYFFEGVGPQGIGTMTKFHWQRALELAKKHGMLPKNANVKPEDLYDLSVLEAERKLK